MQDEGRSGRRETIASSPREWCSALAVVTARVCSTPVGTAGGTPQQLLVDRASGGGVRERVEEWVEIPLRDLAIV